MNNYLTNNDQELLMENYKSIDLKQIILESSIQSFLDNSLNITTLAEAYAILDIYRDFIEEGIISRGIANAARGIGGTFKRGGQNIVRGIRQSGKMAAAAGRGIGDNISGMYKTGANAARAEKIIKQALKAAGELIELIKKASDISPETFTDKNGISQVPNLRYKTLNELRDFLVNTIRDTKAAETQARERGVFGGVGGAIAKAFRGEESPATLEDTPVRGNSSNIDSMAYYKIINNPDILERISSLDGAEVELGPSRDFSEGTITVNKTQFPKLAAEMSRIAARGIAKEISGPKTRNMRGRARAVPVRAGA